MTEQAKPCLCGADDYNARGGSSALPDFKRVPHALNCPKRPNAPGYVAPVSLPGSADQEWDKPAPAPEPSCALCGKPCWNGWDWCESCSRGKESPPAPASVTPASECICEDVRILGACPVHDPPTTDIASDALVAAWRYDLHRIADDERQETPVKDIRQLMNRIESDAKVIAELRADNQRILERLAEVSEAARLVASEWRSEDADNMDEIVAVLEAILAKGDSK